MGTRRTSDLAVSGIGLLTSVATVLLLRAIERRFGIALYGWTLWLVVPAGALCAGLVAASGYYLGARSLHARPSKILLMNILLASTATFFVIHYLHYTSAAVDNRPVSELVSFGTFMDAEIRTASMAFYYRGIKAAETGAVGHWGYGLAALQVLGSAAGGVAVWSHLVHELQAQSHQSRDADLSRESLGGSTRRARHGLYREAASCVGRRSSRWRSEGMLA
jgi:hypothetical protein